MLATFQADKATFYGQMCGTTIYLWREERFCRIIFLGSFSFPRIFVVLPQLSISGALKSSEAIRAIAIEKHIKAILFNIPPQVPLLAWNTLSCGVTTNPTPNAHDGQLVQEA